MKPILNIDVNNKYKPILGKVKLAEFAKEFAKKYQGNLNNIK